LGAALRLLGGLGLRRLRRRLGRGLGLRGGLLRRSLGRGLGLRLRVPRLPLGSRLGRLPSLLRILRRQNGSARPLLRDVLPGGRRLGRLALVLRGLPLARGPRALLRDGFLIRLR
jgi:hypothetical protein